VAQEDRFYAWVAAMQTPNPTTPTLYMAGPNTVRDVADIAAKAAELNPKLIAIDGFYILGRDRRMGMWERTLQNVSDIKLDLCSPLDVPVLATSQLKGTKDKYSLDADADDAAYAKAIGDYADAIRSIHMDQQIELNKQRIFRGKESREFVPVDIYMHFNLDCMNFDEIKVVQPGSSGSSDEAKFDDGSGGKNKGGTIIAGDGSGTGVF
jgi:hypothetical protein